MARKQRSLFQHVLHLALRYLSGPVSVSSPRLVESPQHPLPANRAEWRAYWTSLGQPWRTEPEIDKQRQGYLAQRRLILPDVEHDIYPFKGIKLNRADVEWLLATLDGRGPIDWSDESQRNRPGLDVRGADLRGVDLRHLPLARLCGGLIFHPESIETPEQRERAGVLLGGSDLREVHLEGAYLREAHLERSDFRWAYLEKADFSWAHLEGASLSWAHAEDSYFFAAHLEDANLMGTHLEGAYLSQAQVKRADLRLAHFDKALLENITLSDEEGRGPRLADVHWGNVNLAVVKWSQVSLLLDEYEAKQKKDQENVKGQLQRLEEYEKAVRAYRQLAVALETQGLNEEATRFAYRAHVLQKRVFGLQVIHPGISFKQREQAFGAWLFSWFLFLLAGYGHRLWRSFLAYAGVILVFALIYYLLGISFKSPLSLVNALALSMTSFHGRGLFSGITPLNETVTILASVEAFVGLILEITFIATLTRRFFGK